MAARFELACVSFLGCWIKLTFIKSFHFTAKSYNLPLERLYDSDSQEGGMKRALWCGDGRFPLGGGLLSTMTAFVSFS